MFICLYQVGRIYLPFNNQKQERLFPFIIAKRTVEVLSLLKLFLNGLFIVIFNVAEVTIKK